MGITIVKKKLTVKTVRAGGTPEGAEGAPGAGDIEPAADGGVGSVPGAVMAAEAPAYAGPVVKPASYTLAGVFAIFAVIFFLVLIALQALELDTFTTCFPQSQMSVGGGMAPVPSAVAPAEVVTPVATDPATP